MDQGQEVIVSIADDGPGVPLEELPHLFERFWQRSSPTASYRRQRVGPDYCPQPGRRARRAHLGRAYSWQRPRRPFCPPHHQYLARPRFSPLIRFAGLPRNSFLEKPKTPSSLFLVK
ncbi:MAG: hypothetical protein DRI81_05220 [Chloroflexi bacterium]|nr:MAG: hypothetical protein DRI81_05220 [Chloroflexota bacterium]